MPITSKINHLAIQLFFNGGNQLGRVWPRRRAKPINKVAINVYQMFEEFHRGVFNRPCAATLIIGMRLLPLMRTLSVIRNRYRN